MHGGSCFHILQVSVNLLFPIISFAAYVFLVSRASKSTIRSIRENFNTKEIAEQVGLHQTTIKDIIKEKFNVKEILNSFSKGKTIEELSSYYNLDQTLTWAIVLEGKTEGAIRSARKNGGPAEITNFYKQGKKLDEIAKHIQITQARVSQIFNNTAPSKIKDFYEQGKSPEKIGEVIEREKAKERQAIQFKGKTKEEKDSLRENFPQVKSRSRDKVAEKIHIGSGKQYEKAKSPSLW